MLSNQSVVVFVCKTDKSQEEKAVSFFITLSLSLYIGILLLGQEGSCRERSLKKGEKTLGEKHGSHGIQFQRLN